MTDTHQNFNDGTNKGAKVEHLGSKPGVAPIPPQMGGAQQRPGESAAAGNGAPFGQAPYGQASYGQSAAGAGGSRPRVLSLSDLWNRTSTASGLSAKGREYIETLKHELQNQGSAKEEIRIEPLGKPNEALAAICGNKAIILIFSEAVVSQSSTRPAIAVNGEAKKQLAALYPDTTSITTIVVHPQDYDRAARMAAELRNEFLGVMDPDFNLLSIQTFKDCTLSFTTDRSLISQFLMRFDPHGVADRDDLVLGICASPKNKQNQYYNRPDEQPEGTLLAVVTGYTTFHNVTQGGVLGGKTHIPVVHISRIVTPLQSETSIMMILGLVYERWIYDSSKGLGWRCPYLTIGKDIPNIASLWRDQNTGALMRAENVVQVNDLINQFLTDPILVIDVTAGRAHIPGLEKFCIPELYGEILGSIGMFFLGDPNAVNGSMGAPAQQIFAEITGIHIEGGKYQDSRYIDYLNRVERMGTSNVEASSRLLAPYSDPESNFDVIKSLSPTTEPLYFNQWVKVNPQIASTVCNFLHRDIQIQMTTSAQGSTNFSNFVDSANIVYGGIQSGFGMSGPMWTGGWSQARNVF